MSEVTSTQPANGSNSPTIEAGDFDHDTDIDLEVMDIHTLELNLEDAERLMPQPTTRAPWFGYESYAGYGDEGLDAVAMSDGTNSNDRDAPGPSGNEMGDTKIEEISIGIEVTISNDNDTIDAKGSAVSVGERASASGGSSGTTAGKTGEKESENSRESSDKGKGSDAKQ